MAKRHEPETGKEKQSINKKKKKQKGKRRETCVKTALASRCHPLVREEFENRSTFLSYLRWRADLLLHLYLRWCIENAITPQIEGYNDDGSLCQSEDMHKRKTQTFFRQLMLLGNNTNSTTICSTLSEFWQDIGAQYAEENGLPPPSNFEKNHSTQQITFLAQKMQTNFYTMLWRTYFGRQRKAYKDAEQAKHGKKTKVHQGVLWNQSKRDNGHWDGFRLFYGREPRTYAWDDEQKTWYEDVNKRGEVTSQFLKCNPVVALKAQYDLCRFRERRGLSGFDLAPLSTLQMHSNFYDLSCLWEVAKRIRDKLGKNEIDAVNQSNHQNKVRLANLRLQNLSWPEQARTLNQAEEELGKAKFASEFGFQCPKKKEHFQKEFAESMLSTKKNIGGKHKKEFTGGIDTDGVAVSFHFEADSEELTRYKRAGGTEQNKLQNLTNEEIAGCDPGRSRPVTIATEGGAMIMHKWKYNQATRRYKNQNKQRELDSNVREELRHLSENTSKVSSLEQFHQHIMAQISTWQRRHEYGMRRSVKRRHLDTDIAKNSFVDKFWQMVQNKGITTVMYGNAHVEPTGKGEVPVPVKEIAQSAKKYVKVLMTPEYNTTKKCAACWETAKKKGNGRRIKCRSIVCICRNKGRRDRDLNAAKNIRMKGIMLEEAGDVPAQFQRA